MQCGVEAVAMTIGERPRWKEGRKEGREERKGVSSRQLINECAVKKPFLAGSATAAAVGSRRQGNLSSANGVV